MSWFRFEAKTTYALEVSPSMIEGPRFRALPRRSAHHPILSFETPLTRREPSVIALRPPSSTPDKSPHTLSSRTPRSGDPGRSGPLTPPPGSGVSRDPGDRSGHSGTATSLPHNRAAISGRPRRLATPRPGSPLRGVRDDNRATRQGQPSPRHAFNAARTGPAACVAQAAATRPRLSPAPSPRPVGLH